MWRIFKHVKQKLIERWGLVCIEKQGFTGMGKIIVMGQFFRDVELKYIPLIPLRIVLLLGVPILPKQPNRLSSIKTMFHWKAIWIILPDPYSGARTCWEQVTDLCKNFAKNYLPFSFIHSS